MSKQPKAKRKAYHKADYLTVYAPGLTQPMREIAAREKRSVGQLVRFAIEAYLKTRGAKA
jgi:hypothetical protein